MALFIGPILDILGAVLNGLAACVQFGAEIYSSPQSMFKKSFWHWPWQKKPDEHYVLHADGEVGKVASESKADDIVVTPEVAASLEESKREVDQLDNIVAKCKPTRKELGKMSKLEIEIVANAHGVTFPKKTLKKAMIRQLVKELKIK